MQILAYTEMFRGTSSCYLVEMQLVSRSLNHMALVYVCAKDPSNEGT